MRRFLLIVTAMLLVFPAAASARWEPWDWIVDESLERTVTDRDRARELMRSMTVREKVYQLFIVSPEALTGADRITLWPEDGVFALYPVGGVALYGQNIFSQEQLTALCADIADDARQAGAYAPFLAVDEEGGSVSRVANKLGYPLEMAPGRIGKLQDPALSEASGRSIAAYLLPLGINLDFAPVADVLIGEENEIGDRAYGKDADLTARMVLAMASGLREGGIIPCFKHFPGHGAAVGSTHSGEAISSRTLEEMRQTDWLPFREAIADGAEMIMISHLTAKELDAKAPSSLSSVIITDYLRGELGFDGVVITDALRMDAITENYNSGPAALAAFQAGADILLLPNNLEKAADAILKAVEAGEIPMERLNESVERILALKIQYGIIR